MRERLAFGEKPLDWVGSSKQDFLGLSEPVKVEIGECAGTGPVRRQASKCQAVEG